MAILFVCTTSFAQSKIPTVVKQSFNNKFKNATNVKWGKENTHEFEAEFKFEGMKCSANFTDKGEWIETETPIQFNQLPEKIKSAFNKSNKGLKIKAVAKIESSTGKFTYEIEIKQFLKSKELFYNSNGNEINK